MKKLVSESLASFINEVNFKRGENPHNAMGIGMKAKIIDEINNVFTEDDFDERNGPPDIGIEFFYELPNRLKKFGNIKIYKGIDFFLYLFESLKFYVLFIGEHYESYGGDDCSDIVSDVYYSGDPDDITIDDDGIKIINDEEARRLLDLIDKHQPLNEPINGYNYYADCK